MNLNNLSCFDILQNGTHLDEYTVAALFDCKVPTILALLRRSEIPAPCSYGSDVRFKEKNRAALLGDRACSSSDRSE